MINFCTMPDSVITIFMQSFQYLLVRLLLLSFSVIVITIATLEYAKLRVSIIFETRYVSQLRLTLKSLMGQNIYLFFFIIYVSIKKNCFLRII